VSDLLRVAEAAARECIRQGVGVDRLGSLLVAYDHAHGLARDGEVPNDWNLLGYGGLAKVVEPDNGGMVRSVPVSFADGSQAVAPGILPQALDGWFSAVREVRGGNIPVDTWIKEFLDIHPFVDGNGRTAWILRVWMLDQWDDPEPLPDYYGESTTGAPQARSTPDPEVTE
jgi:hypothetical protein